MKTIIVDAQVLQTPALQRGMGQYIVSILQPLRSNKELQVILVFSSLIQNDLTQDAKNRLKDFKQVDLPLQSLMQTKNTSEAITKNKKILNSWIQDSNNLGAVFIIGSVFQSEVFPAYPDNVIKAAIMYDVIPLQHFHQYAPKMRWGDYLERFKIVYESNKLLCISQTTASDLQVYANVKPEALSVINGGPGDLADPVKPTNISEEKFILMPTGNDIRKNNINGVEAFIRFNGIKNNGYKLVITSLFTDEEKQRLMQLCPEVVFTGIISDGELAWYYEHSSAILFPSLYEGLGMPLIEALIFKKPIAASNIDVFLEISPSVAEYFNPLSIEEMSSALIRAVDNKPDQNRRIESARVVKKYTWENSASHLVAAVDGVSPSIYSQRKRIAVVGPHVTGSSAIGKFIAELNPILSEAFQVDYYFEKSTIDKVLRPDILGHITDYQPINKLTGRKLKSYDQVIYHVGNSNHHSLTLARALTYPGICILHDLNIENIYTDLVSRKLIAPERYKLEQQLDKLTKSKTNCLQSLVNSQNALIVHSEYAKNEVSKVVSADKIHRAQLAVSTPLFVNEKHNKSFTIGLAGILAGIKGIKTIERIATLPEFQNDKFLLFGLNFAEPGILDQLRMLPNVEIATDLSDFEFQQNLKKLDVLVNYRTKYQGEASYATLEAMRYGIPVMVRGDFGWYSELPDNSVLKAMKEEELPGLLSDVKSNKNTYDLISKTARETTTNLFSVNQYVEVIKKITEKL